MVDCNVCAVTLWKSKIRPFDMYIPEDGARLMRDTRRRLNGENVGTVEYTARRKDGTTFPVMTYTSPIIREGKIAGLRGITMILLNKKSWKKRFVRR